MECQQTEPAETTTAGEMTHFLSLSLIIHKIFKICEVESLITSLKSMLSGVTATLVFSCILQFFYLFILGLKNHLYMFWSVWSVRDRPLAYLLI